MGIENNGEEKASGNKGKNLRLQKLFFKKGGKKKRDLKWGEGGEAQENERGVHLSQKGDARGFLKQPEWTEVARHV